MRATGEVGGWARAAPSLRCGVHTARHSPRRLALGTQKQGQEPAVSLGQQSLHRVPRRRGCGRRPGSWPLGPGDPGLPCAGSLGPLQHTTHRRAPDSSFLLSSSLRPEARMEASAPSQGPGGAGGLGVLSAFSGLQRPPGAPLLPRGPHLHMAPPLHVSPYVSYEDIHHWISGVSG